MVTPFEDLFPGLRGTPYRITSPRDRTYNCIAWAVGDTRDYWWPGDPQRTYWPVDIPRLYEEARVALQVGQRLSGSSAVTNFAGLGLSRLLSGQTAVRVGVLERLEPVVDLHRGLHPLDVVLVVR